MEKIKKRHLGIKQSIKLIDGTDANLFLDINNGNRYLRSKNYNFDAIGDVSSGYSRRYGESLEADADLILGLPEIADIEISEVCSAGCKFCYKRNTSDGKNMSYETFTKVFNKLPKTITQIAFGIGDVPLPHYYKIVNEIVEIITKEEYEKHKNKKNYYFEWVGGNPDMWKIFEYSRKKSVMANLTINGFRMSEEAADMLKKYCGAVAVSIYDKESSYNTIKMLTDRGMKQINIHYFLSEETYDNLFELFKDIKTDPRLEKINAVVFLSLKKKGRASDNDFHRVSEEKFKRLIDYVIGNNFSFGFDSCTAQKVNLATKNEPYYNNIKNIIEPCESTLYSMYINTEGIYYPCSFTEGEIDWVEGIDVKECNDFLQDVWYNEKTKQFKEKCIKCRESGVSCPAGYHI